MLNTMLRQLKKQSNLTAREIADISGIPLPTIHKLLSGETTNPKYETLKAIVEAFSHQLKIVAISDEKQLLSNDKETEIIASYRKLSSRGKELINKSLLALIDYEKIQFEESYQELPLYLLSASAGIGNYLDSEQYELKSFPREIIPDKAKYAIRVSGNSMEPFYFQNDIVFIEPANSLDPGDVGIIVINGEGFIKQFQKNEFISFNSDYKAISPGEYDEIRVVGKVLGRY